MVGAAGGASSIDPINIGLTILRKKIEDLMNVRGVGEKSFIEAQASHHGCTCEGRAGQSVKACGCGRGRSPRRPRPPVDRSRRITARAATEAGTIHSS